MEKETRGVLDPVIESSIMLFLQKGCDRRVVLHVLPQDDWVGLQAVVDFYQMEQRNVLRQRCLLLLHQLCEVAPEIVSQLLTTQLPCELARILTSFNHSGGASETIRLPLILLTTLFSTGESIPFQHYDVL